MCDCANRIGLSGQSHLILIFYGPALFDSELEEGEVFLVEFEERNVVADLVGYRPDRRRGVRMCEGRCYLVCCEDLVNIVEGESFVFGQRQTRPYYGFGFNGRDEQGRLVVLDIICEVRVRQCASRQVVEESTLSKVVASVNAEGGVKRGGGRPT